MPGRWRRTRALLPRGTKPPKLKPSKGAIRTAAGFRFTRLELIVKMKSRKRKQKKESFPRDSKSRSKSKLGEGVEKQMLIVGEFLTLKKKVSRMQIEGGAGPNFLIIMLNRLIRKPRGRQTPW